MRRWIPFILFVLAIIFLLGFLLLTGQSDDYIPTSSEPDTVYKEACAECHGKNGQSEGFIYPDISDSSMGSEKVEDLIRNGDFLMPAFPNIPDSTLKKLAAYVAAKGFVNE